MADLHELRRGAGGDRGADEPHCWPEQGWVLLTSKDKVLTNILATCTEHFISAHRPQDLLAARSEPDACRPPRHHQGRSRVYAMMALLTLVRYRLKASRSTLRSRSASSCKATSRTPTRSFSRFRLPTWTLQTQTRSKSPKKVENHQMMPFSDLSHTILQSTLTATARLVYARSLI